MIKNNIKTFVLLFVFAIFSLCLTLDVQAKDYVCQKLKSGQTVIVKKVSDNPIVTINTWIKTGSINEDDKNSGVAHFLEHLFFKGTQKNPTGTFDRILESKGANTNAATSKDFTHYYITIPSKDFDLALSLHSDMLLNPLIPRKELEKERLVVLEEISKGKDSPTNVMWENLFSLIYGSKEPKHPYFRPVIGKKEVIETITREEILDFYNKFYTPSNMTTVIVGDIDPDDALKKVEQYFTPQGELRIANEVVYPKIKPLDSILRVSDEMDVNQAYAVIAFKAPKFKDDKDTYALDVLAAILGDSKSSKLNQMLKEQKHLVYSISASNSSFMDDGLFTISATLDEKNLKEVEGEILEEIKKVQNGEVSQAEVNKAKNMIKTDTYYSRESVSNISDELGYLTTFWGSCAYYDNYLNNIEKVTRSDVIRVAKKYLNPNHAVISIVLPESESTENIKKISNVEKKEPVIIKNEKNITQYKLSNNINLIINHNQLNDIVAMQIYAKGGNFVAKKQGVGNITAAGMMKGTKKYSAIDLSQTMEQNGIQIAPANNSDYFSISIKTTKNDLDLTFDLLNEIVNNASFDAQEIEKIKTEQIYAIQRSRDIPSSVAFEDFKTAIWAGTPYGITGKVLEKTIPTISRQDVIDFYTSVFCPENLVISINGNVDDKAIINKLSDIFYEKKNCTASNFDYKKYNNCFKQLSQNKIIKTNKESEAAWVVIGWLTDGITENSKKDLASLQVIDSILGTGMSSRLFNRLRDEQGLAYQVGSTFLPNINQGVFAVYIGTNPKTALHSRNELLKEINLLKKEFVSDKELQEAKDKILGNFILAQETNMEKASTLGWFEVSGRGIDYLNEYPQLIKSITAADVIKAANKYFDAPNVTTIVAPQSCLKGF